MSFTSFEGAEEIVDRFMLLLDKHCIDPFTGSKIEDEFLSPLQLLVSTRNCRRLASSPDLLADAGGMYDLAAKLLAVATQPEFESFLPHLRLFEANGVFATVVRPRPGHSPDDVNRKVSELYIGSLAVHFAFDVQLDDPVHSKGDNPDVMLELEDQNNIRSRWALAIKSLSSRSGQTIFENIQKAAQQIDAPACAASRGLVVVNLTHSLSHDDLWKRSYRSETEAKQAMSSQMDGLIGAAEKDRPASEWESLFAGRTSPVLFYYAHAVVRLNLPGRSDVPTILKMSKVANPLNRNDSVAMAIAHNLNDHMQKILRGIPGANGQAPS